MNMWEEQHETTAEVNAGNQTNLPCSKRKKIVGNITLETEPPDTQCDEAVLLDGTDNDVEPSLKSH